MVLVVPRSLHRRIGQVPAPGVLGWPSFLPQLPLYEVICPLHAEELNHVMRLHTLVTNFHCFNVSRKSSTSQENWTSSSTRCAGSTKHPATVTTVWGHPAHSTRRKPYHESPHSGHKLSLVSCGRAPAHRVSTRNPYMNGGLCHKLIWNEAWSQGLVTLFRNVRCQRLWLYHTYP